MITYESICQKLGFAFDDDKNYRRNVSAFEDDNSINPYVDLSEAELDFIERFLKGKMKLRTA
jgi:hypothetical protein